MPHPSPQQRFLEALPGLSPQSLDAALRYAVDAGWRHADLAEALGVSRRRVTQRVWNARIKSLVCPVAVPDPPTTPRRRRRSPEEVAHLADVVAGYKAGASIRQLAERFDLGRRTVHGILVDAGVQMRPRSVPLPKRPPLPPIGPEDLAGLAKAYRAGYSTRDVAEAIGMSRNAARNRLKRAGCQLRRPGGNHKTGPVNP